MYDRVIIEISGVCNAKCPWCATGYINRQGIKEVIKNKYITYYNFTKAIDYLVTNKIIATDTTFLLYSWYEPTLNPDFKKIILFLNERNFNYEISTNASKQILFEKGTKLDNLQTLIFSMCGFSQKSYDKIHGFNFEKIKNNILAIVNNYRDLGFKGSAILSYHVYQFNYTKEFSEAFEFAKENNIIFKPIPAIIAHPKLAKSYVTYSLETEILNQLSKNLFINNFDEVLLNRPKNYSCIVKHNPLTIDENLNVVTCCVSHRSEPDSILGSLFNMSYEDIIAAKNNSSYCKKCSSLKLDYYFMQISHEKYSELDFLCRQFELIDEYNNQIYLHIIKNLITLNNEIFLFAINNNLEKFINLYHNILKKKNISLIILDNYKKGNLSDHINVPEEYNIIIKTPTSNMLNNKKVIVFAIEKYEQIKIQLENFGAQSVKFSEINLLN